MQKGKRTNPRKDKNYFRWTADFTHRFNVKRKPMRGGIRL